ncbi:MAG: hypothetical protein IJ225_10540 [Solobacterium sp.]|nr:hypothetical protein [Solobacterium sp.]
MAQTLTDREKALNHEDGLGIIEQLANISDRIGKESSDKIWHHGFKRNNADGNPATRISPLFDTVNVAPAYMDYTNGVFVPGGWQWLIDKFYPVMVNMDGTEAYRLNKFNHKLKENGEASDAFNIDSDLNAMSCLTERVYRKHYEVGDVEYFEFSNVKLDDDFHCDAFVRNNKTIASKAYFPMFKGQIDSKGRLRSIGGQALNTNTTATAEVAAATAMGEQFSIWDLSHRTLIEELLILMSMCDNVQLSYGQGQTSGYVNDASQNYGHRATGTLFDKGPFFGFSDTTHEIKAFYIEGLWGNRWDRVLGCVLVNDVLKCKASGPYNLTGEGYTEVGITLPANGWQKETQNTRFGSFPKEVGGSDSTYICDYWYKNASGTRVLIGGGDCYSGSFCGRYWHLASAASHAAWTVGASLLLEQPEEA